MSVAPRQVVLLLCLIAGLATAVACADKAQRPSAEERYAEIDARMRRAETASGWDSLWGVLTANPVPAFEDLRKEWSQLRIDYPFSRFAVEAELRTADAFFAQELYQEAEASYAAFIKNHPSHPKLDYVLYQQALCHLGDAPTDTFSWLFGTSYSVDRDMSSVLSAYVLMGQVAERYPESEWAKKSIEKRFELSGILADHEIFVGKFYLRQEAWEPAAARFATARERYPESSVYGKASYLLGLALEEGGHTDKAILAYESVLGLAPQRFPERPEIHPIDDTWTFIAGGEATEPVTGENYWKSLAERRLKHLREQTSPKPPAEGETSAN